MRRVPVVCAFLALVLGWAASSGAQPMPALAPAQMSSSVSMETHGYIQPEVKITSFDKQTGLLIGVSAGTLQEGKLLFGVGFQTLLVGDRANRGLTYGGVIFGWVFGQDRPWTLVVRTLAGYGRIVATYAYPDISCEDDPTVCTEFDLIKERTTFLAIEPDAAFVARLGERVRFSAGAGYRFGNRANPYDPSPKGPTVSLSFLYGF